jgi:predicted metallo-beta-lactamase superfamily hydrolase
MFIMSINLSKYTDGFSPLPVSLIQPKKQTLSKFYGDPFISALSNLMIKSITGNSSLKNARVICISDYHYDLYTNT